ncbi:MAG: fibronectin type III domain-containing protein [Deltaproteobacteria bacterium]|nr:fibronectin type III domain-containing protein [Deltaproteobacteria bacterium]
MRRKEILSIPFLAISLVLIFILSGCGPEPAPTGGTPEGTINLAWDSNTEPDLAGYKVHYGTALGVYEKSIDVGMATQSNGTTYYTLTGLTKGQTYYIAVTAYDTSGNESDYSNEVNGPAKSFGFPSFISLCT